MEITPEEPLHMLENRILNRVDSQDRSNILSLIRNVSLFIKRAQGQPLNAEEQNYPSHPLFSHTEQAGGQNTAEILLYRLRLVDMYQLETAHSIVDLLTRTISIREEQPLSMRKAQILWHLNRNPAIPKYKLAKNIGTTPRTLSKDLVELERDYALRIFSSPDPHKFHLIVKKLMGKNQEKYN